MKKLTAENSTEEIARLREKLEPGWRGLSMREELYLQALEIALPILEQRSVWIKCAPGQMPPDREQVILWDADLEEHSAGHYSHQTGNFYNCGMIIENEITHWMPAPESPEQESQKEVNHE